MKKETYFFIYCIERYRYYKELSGAATAEIFAEHNIYDYVCRYFNVLHIMSDRNIVQDIDEYIQLGSTAAV